MFDGMTRDAALAKQADSARNVFVETPGIFMATSFFAPLAAAAETHMFWRKSFGLAKRWRDDLEKCRSAPELIEVNAKFGERALALSYSKFWRIAENSALLGRRAVAPESMRLRGVGEK